MTASERNRSPFIARSQQLISAELRLKSIVSRTLTPNPSPFTHEPSKKVRGSRVLVQCGTLMLRLTSEWIGSLMKWLFLNWLAVRGRENNQSFLADVSRRCADLNVVLTRIGFPLLPGRVVV